MIKQVLVTTLLVTTGTTIHAAEILPHPISLDSITLALRSEAQQKKEKEQQIAKERANYLEQAKKGDWGPVTKTQTFAATSSNPITIVKNEYTPANCFIETEQGKTSVTKIIEYIKRTEKERLVSFDIVTDTNHFSCIQE